MENKASPYPNYPEQGGYSSGYSQPPPSYPSTQPAYPQQGYNPQGYPPNAAQGYPPTVVQPGIQPTVVVPAPNLSSSVIVLGGSCPNCRVGVLTDHYDGCAICVAICFFPLGVLCCLAMRKKQCQNCGTVFG